MTVPQDNATPSRSFRGYAAGNGGIAILRQIIVFMPLYFYSPPAGRGAELLLARSVGLALFLARIADVISDPVVGWLSDRTRHRWGKRLPYLVYGAPVWLAATLLIFRPPAGEPGSANFFWLTGMAVLFFLGMTTVQVPYLAVLPEIAPSEDTAIRVASRMGRWFIAGALFVMSAGWYIGMRFGFPTAIALCATAAALLLAMAIRDLFAAEQRPRPPETDPFWRSAWSVAREKPFWTYLIGFSLFVCGYYTILVASPYFVTEIVRMPGTMTPVFFLLPMLTAIGLAPVVERAALRFGKKRVLLAAMGLMFALALAWFAIAREPAHGAGPVLSDLLPLGAEWAARVRVSVLAQSLALFLLVGASVSVLLLFPPAIVADLVAYDAGKTGRPRESLVYGLQGGIEKNAVMIATLAASLALEKGKEAGHTHGIRLVGLVAAVMILAGAAVFSRFPLEKGWRP